MTGHVLVVDDEKEICELVRLHLEREGFRVDLAGSARVALNRLNSCDYDLLVLDIMLPGIDGNELARLVRQHNDLPILMLSARDTDVDKAVSLGIGADDYLTKPYSPVELIARVRALLRRYRQCGEAGWPETGVRSAGPLRVDLNRMRVWRSGSELQLTHKEFELLRLFITHPGQVFTKVQIFEAVWGGSYLDDDNTVMVAIRRLRAKIEEDPANPVLIGTVWGLGYRLEGVK